MIGKRPSGHIPFVIFLSALTLGVTLASDTTAQTLPGPPQFFGSAVIPNSPDVRFNWQPPTTGDAPTSYRIEIGTAPDQSDRAIIDVGNVLTWTVSLPPGPHYARVRARNAAGLGPPSLESRFLVTCGATETGPPRELAARWFGTALQLTWRNPAGLSEGQVGYRVEVGAAPDDYPYQFDVPVTPTWVTFDIRQVPFTSPVYYVRVRTISRCASNLASAPVQLAWPPPPAPGVVINEFGPFIELANTSPQPVSIAGWRIHMSLGTTVIVRKVLDEGATINPGCRYLIAPEQGYAFPAVSPDATMPVTDADGMALAKADGMVVDQVARLPRAGQFSSPFAEGTRLQTSADSYPLGSSLSYSRRANAQDTNDNQADFVLQTPTPEAASGCGTTPGAPLDLRSLVNGSVVTLAWTPPQTGEVVQYYFVEAGSFPGDATLAQFVTPLTTVTVAGVPVGTYYVRVRAVGAHGAGPPSNEIVVLVCGGACGPVASPPRQLAASVSGTTVVLTWLPPVVATGLSEYLVEAGSQPGLADLAVLAVLPQSTSLIVNGVPPNTYYVRVRSRSSAGISAASNEVIVRVPQ